MNKLLNLSGLLLLLAILGFSKFSHGQIIVNSGPEVTPIDMVESLLGEGVLYTNVSFQGADVARGIFSNGESTNIGIDKGVFLTSGAGYIIPGPNNSTSAGANLGLGGHPSLNAISTATTYDATVLEFDILVESDTLKLTYVFGSEEYNEYVGSSLIDVFGLFVTGPNPMGGYYNDKNIAIVPGTVNNNVSINNVNNGWSPGGVVSTGPCTNCEYYSDNTYGLTLQYDGFTTVLVAWLLVVPCEEYHMIIGVADAGDHIFDSGVFLEENSITCPKIELEAQLNPPDISNDIVEGFVEADIIFKLPHPDYSPLTVYFEVGGTANPAPYDPDGGDFEEGVPTNIDFEEGEDSAAFNVTPVYDGIIEGDETLELIVENSLGCIDRYDTVVLTILDYIEMDAQTSPDTMICIGHELDLWINILSGSFPPYTYLWEPGGYTNDSITLSPEETTTYMIAYSDMFSTLMDSIIVTVMPLDYEIFSFSFETENNPTIFVDIIGEIFEDSISLDVPYGTNLNNLVATFSLSDGAWAIVNGEDQISGVSANDFTNQVTYIVIAPGGCTKDWVVNVNLVTGVANEGLEIISISPNPAKDIIYIYKAKGYELSIINNLGVELYQNRINSAYFSVDVSKFENGIYYLQFTNHQQQFSSKIIVDR